MIRLQPFFTPEEIERESFAIIDAEAPALPFSAQEWEVARRMIHACGDMDIAHSIVFQNNAVEAGIQALRAGCLVLTDTRMAEAGISRACLAKLGGSCRSLFDFPDVAVFTEAGTKSRRAVKNAEASLPGCVFVAGNAPTALLGLLDYLDGGGAAPALVIAMPVGFVNAAQSKALVQTRPLPAIIVEGRRGGTPPAVAAVNALARMALREAEKI